MVRLTLSEIVDLEAQLIRDGEQEPDRLWDRDRALSAELAANFGGDEPVERTAVVREWLDLLRRKTGGTSLGERMQQGFRLLTVVSVVAGLVAGWGAAQLVMAFDGTHPVNVISFLGVFVFAQMALVLLYLAMAIAARSDWARRLNPLDGVLVDLFRSVGMVLSRLSGRVGRSDGESAFASAGRRLTQIRSRSALYQGVERRRLMSAIQAWAVAFNVGALLGALRLIAFTDLAFGWGSTLQLSVDQLTGLCSAMAAPFGWIWPDAVPSAELIAQTQYARLEGAFVAGSSSTQTGLWWPFLVASLICYGLLPRVVTLAASARSGAKLLGRFDLDHRPDVAQLMRRLRPRHVDTRGGGGGSELDEPGGESSLATAFTADGGECVVVLWRDAPGDQDALRRLLGDELDLTVSARFDAGGADYAVTEAALSALASEHQGRPIAILVEPFVDPDRAFRRFAGEVRQAVGPDVGVHVFLVASASERSKRRLRLWRQELQALGDARLGVDLLGRAP